MDELNLEKINMFYDLIDQACMAIYADLNIDYLECLYRVGNDVLFEIDDSKISDETYEKLKVIYSDLGNQTFNSESIRLALELLMVKAFKHSKKPLDIMTPDTIAYILSIIIRDKYEGKDISILDTLLGTSNLLQAVSNNIEGNNTLIGIEREEYLVKLCEISSNLQMNEMKIYFQDALNDVNDIVDVVIGDVPSSFVDDNTYLDLELVQKGIRYFPYLLIEKRLKNIVDDGYFMFIIDNDFFKHDTEGAFRKFLADKVTLMSLIVLPVNLVQRTHVGKSILIGKKATLKDYHMTIFNIPSFNAVDLNDTLNKLKEMIKEI